MALPITIPYTFANATVSIPLSHLDSDFTTVVDAINGLGNGSNTISVTTTGGSTARTLPNHFNDILNVKDFGAVGNGTTDDTTAIQNAITYAQSLGASVWFSPGTYLVAGQLTLGNVKLYGPGTFTRNAAAGDYGDTSAVIWITSTTLTPLRIAANGAVNIDGLVFYWPNQNVSTTPIAYPPLFAGTSGSQMIDMTINNCVVINAYDFMSRDAALTSMGDIRITNCRIYAIRRVFNFSGSVPESILINSCFFTPGVFENVSIFANSAYLRNWTANNGTFLYCNAGTGSSVDGFSISNSLVYGYGNGVSVVSGGSYGFLSTGTSWDNVGQLISVTNAAYMIGANFIGGAMWLARNNGGSSTDSGIYINTTYLINISFDGVEFNKCNGHLFEILGTGTGNNAISVTGGNITSWGANLSATSDVYALYVNAPNATVVFQPDVAYNDAASGVGVYMRNVKSSIISGVWRNTRNFLISNASFTGKVKLSNLTTTESVSTNFVLNNTPSTTSVIEAGQGCLFDEANPTYGWPIMYLYNSSLSSTAYGAGPTTVTFGGTTPQKIEGLTYASGVITCISTGYYRWDVSLSNDGTTATGTQYKIYAETGGTNVRKFGALKTFTNTYVDSAVISGSAYFIAGDTLKIVVERVSASGTWTTSVDGTINYITVAKLA